MLESLTIELGPDYEKRVQQVQRGGTIFVSDSLRDPLDFPDLEQFIIYCAQKEKKVSISTNGKNFKLAPMIALYNVTVVSCIVTLDKHQEWAEEFIPRFNTTRNAALKPEIGLRVYDYIENSEVFTKAIREWLLTRKVDFIVRTFDKYRGTAPESFGFKGVEILRDGPEVEIFTHSDYTQKFYSLEKRWSGLSWQKTSNPKYDIDANEAESGFAEF
jgi:hypothetical protein